MKTFTFKSSDNFQRFPSLVFFIIYQHFMFLAVTKQLYEWSCPSILPSVTHFSLCSHPCIIMKFSGVITNDRSDVHARGQGQRSKIKVTEVKTFPDCNSSLNSPSCYEMMHKAWSSVEEVPCCFTVSSVKFQGHTAKTKIDNIDPNWAFPDCNSSLNSQRLWNDAQSLQ